MNATPIRNLVTWWLGAILLMAGCYTVPETGRKSLVVVPPEQEAQLGAQAFAEIRTQERISTDPNALARVTRVGQRIAAAVGDDLPTAQWEFVVFDSPELNAFALPGGKVGVYTGLLNLATSDDELAIVIGHEIAHVTARHGGERMTMQQGVQLGGAVLGGVADSRLSGNASNLLKLAYGAGSQLLGVLPHSRMQESEADKIGLRYAARAGYDPRAAVTFWLKMNQQKQGAGAPPKFLSTHPSGDDRIADLNAEIPLVIPLYEEARRRGAGQIGRPEIGRPEIGR
jgi:predicted Zn-dependent protease